MKLVKLFSIAAAGLMLVAACGSPRMEGSQKVLDLLPDNGQVDSASYLMGVNFGLVLKDSFEGTLDMCQLRKGMNDALKAKGKIDFADSAFVEQFKIDPNLMNMVLNQYVGQLHAYKAALEDEKGTEFRQKFMAENAADSTATGIVYKIQDSGSQMHAESDRDTVLVNYRGTHLNGEVFDQNDSISFALNNVIKGWGEGMKLVGEGGKITLVIPGKLAYPYGSRGGIEPNETLLFDVEVLEVHPYVEPAPVPEKTTPAKGKKLRK